ncbi:MAG: YfbR-like 5'-deoxynucleotidase [Cohaesibacteraceae bacterium]
MNGGSKRGTSKTGQQQVRVWQRMLSGRRLDLVDPSPLDIEVEDIAHGLARVARWNGQTLGDHAFSVAQHSLLVVDLVDALTQDKASPDLRLAALLHDAAEYVIGDMISPFKGLLGDGYRTIEQRLSTAVHLRHQLPAALPKRFHDCIKKADAISAYLEATQLAGFSTAEADKVFGRPPGALSGITLQPMPATEAENRFLEQHRTLFTAHIFALTEKAAPASGVSW